MGLWEDLSFYPEGAVKSAYRYMRFWWWATSGLLMFGMAFVRFGGFWGAVPGLALLSAVVRIKHRYFKEIFGGRGRKHLLLPLIVSFIYLTVFWLYLATAEDISSAAMVGSVVFLVGMTGLAFIRGSRCESVLQRYYPWVAGKYPIWKPGREHYQMGRLEKELGKLYGTTENPVVREAIEKRESTAAIWVLMCETIVLSWWGVMIFQ